MPTRFGMKIVGYDAFISPHPVGASEGKQLTRALHQLLGQRLQFWQIFFIYRSNGLRHSGTETTSI